MKVIKYLTFLTLAMQLSSLSGQEMRYPQIDKACPDFTFSKIINYPAKTVTNNDLLGKYIVLDFWTASCTACFQSFPKVNELQKKFKDSLKVILVGFDDIKRDVEGFYKIFEQRNNLKLTVAFDSTNMSNMVPNTVPHLIWIDKGGTIKAITSAEDFNEGNIRKFINDKKFVFTDVSYEGLQLQRIQVDRSKPLLIDGNGGNDTSYIFRSVLSEWKSGMGRMSISDIGSYLNIKETLARYQAIKTSVEGLFKVAYFGTVAPIQTLAIFPNIEFDLKDSTLLCLFNEKQVKLFNYCLQIPKSSDSKVALMKKMQLDLLGYFGLTGEIVEEERLCYRLSVSDTQLFQTALEAKKENFNHWALESKKNGISSVSLDILPGILSTYLPRGYHPFNATGSRSYIGIQVNGKIDEIENIRIALKKYGLEFKIEKQRFKILKLSDKI